MQRRDDRSTFSRTAHRGWWSLVLVAALPLLLAASSSRQIERVSVVDDDGGEVFSYGRSHALVIGVGRYSGGWPSLESVDQEVTEVGDVLEQHGFDVRIVLDPSSEEMLDAFRSFINAHGYERDNRLLFYFAGHGHTRDDGRKGYLVPGEAPDPRRDEKGFLRAALPMTQVVAWAKAIEARHALFVFDSCFSGTVFKTRSAPPEPPPHITRSLAAPVRQFITAGSAGEAVPAKSVFSPALVRALRGAADRNNDGYIVGTELGMYLREEVPGYGTGQVPQFGKIKDPDLDSGDFVFKVPASLRSSQRGPADALPEALSEAPPRRGDLPLPRLEQIARIREEWALYLGDMKAAYEKVFELDESLYVVPDKKAEAWRRFLGAYGEDDPFSGQDDHFRSVAMRRMGQLEEASVLGEPDRADETAVAETHFIDMSVFDGGLLHFRSGHHLGRLHVDPEIRPCADDHNPRPSWTARKKQACWELVPYVEDTDGERSFFYRADGGYFPQPANRVVYGSEKLLRLFAFTSAGDQLADVEAYRFHDCVRRVDPASSWAAVRPAGCMVVASEQRYREVQTCGGIQGELCLFFDRR